TDEPQASLETLYAATSAALEKISDALNKPAQIYYGTTEFYPQNIRDTFRDKTVNFSETIAGGNGVSQNDLSVGKSRLDLSEADWFAYNDNFGTSEERRSSNISAATSRSYAKFIGRFGLCAMSVPLKFLPSTTAHVSSPIMSCSCNGATATLWNTTRFSSSRRANI
ncbi:MAG: hypothetical protein IKD80_07070, partial [Selenomonadaceae bacterium]|nr:hypothetical protein [Selenomonadaceae bacterium]